MQFDKANSIGRAGERDVSVLLHKLAARHRFQVLDDVLLLHFGSSAQIDHVVVDNFGVLVVETKVRKGAVIRGTDVEKKWTACYRGRGNHVFQNPLYQNRHHESMLREVLKSRGLPLDPNYVKSVVVFVGADISKLELAEIERQRVTAIDGLEAFLLDRRLFAVNAGGWDQAKITATFDILSLLNQSGDADAQREHAQNVRGPRPNSPFPAQADVPPWKQPAVVAPADQPRSSALLGAPPRSVAPQSRDVTIRLEVPPRLQYALVKLGRQLAAYAIMLALVWWLFFGGGMFWLLRLSPLFAPSSPVAAPTQTAPAGLPPVQAQPRQQVTLQAAQATFQQNAPDIYAKVIDKDTPRVFTEGGNTVYEWHFFVQQSSNAVETKAARFSFAPDGSFRGMSFR